MGSVNAFLKIGEIVVAIEDCYCESNGAFSVAHIWNGEEVRTFNYSNGYNDAHRDAAKIDAMEEQVLAASEWYINNAKSLEEGRKNV